MMVSLGGLRSQRDIHEALGEPEDDGPAYKLRVQRGIASCPQHLLKRWIPFEEPLPIEGDCELIRRAHFEELSTRYLQRIHSPWRRKDGCGWERG